MLLSGQSTRAVLINTGARVDSLTLGFFAFSSGFSTRAVLINTGARVDVSVASHILIFALLLPRFVSSYSSDPENTQTHNQSVKCGKMTYNIRQIKETITKFNAKDRKSTRLNSS